MDIRTKSNMMVGIVLSLILGFASVLAVAPLIARAEAPTWPGAGTPESPYLLSTCDHVWELGFWTDAMPELYRDKNYKLVDDINCTGYGSEFVPIGSGATNDESLYFTGTLNGAGYSINGLEYAVSTNSETAESGFFGALGNGAVVKDLHLSNLGIAIEQTGTSYGTIVGGLAAYANDQSTIQRVSAEGTIAVLTNGAVQNSIIGGLVGVSYETIQDSYANMQITAENANSSTAITNQFYVGGLVGSAYESSVISSSYAMGTIEASGGRILATGGLAGSHAGASLSNVFSAPSSYTTSSGVSGAILATGVAIGTISNSSHDLSTVYALAIDGYNKTGNIADQSDGNSVNVIDDTDPGIAYFKSFANAPLNSWNNDTVWTIDGDGMVNDGLPYLLPPQEEPEPQLDYEDLNGDSISDSEQPNVGGYVSSITGKIVAIDVGDSCELTTDDMSEEKNHEIQDSAYDYADGLWDFEADCVIPGATTTIKLYYYDVSIKDKVARKYNPETGAYFTISDAVLTKETINGSSVAVVTYDITDNGEMDLDPEDGLIADPAGIASLVVGSPNTGLRPITR